MEISYNININFSDDGEKNETAINSKKQEKSKRQVKREKAELRASEVRETNKLETAKNALNYVSKVSFFNMSSRLVIKNFYVTVETCQRSMEI